MSLIDTVNKNQSLNLISDLAAEADKALDTYTSLTKGELEYVNEFQYEGKTVSYDKSRNAFFYNLNKFYTKPGTGEGDTGIKAYLDYDAIKNSFYTIFNNSSYTDNEKDDKINKKFNEILSDAKNNGYSNEEILQIEKNLNDILNKIYEQDDINNNRIKQQKAELVQKSLQKTLESNSKIEIQGFSSNVVGLDMSLVNNNTPNTLNFINSESSASIQNTMYEKYFSDIATKYGETAALNLFNAYDKGISFSDVNINDITGIEMKFTPASGLIATGKITALSPDVSMPIITTQTIRSTSNSNNYLVTTTISGNENNQQTHTYVYDKNKAIKINVIKNDVDDNGNTLINVEVGEGRNKEVYKYVQHNNDDNIPKINVYDGTGDILINVDVGEGEDKQTYQYKDPNKVSLLSIDTVPSSELTINTTSISMENILDKTDENGNLMYDIETGKDLSNMTTTERESYWREKRIEKEKAEREAWELENGEKRLLSPGIKLLTYYKYDLASSIGTRELLEMNGKTIDISSNFLNGNSITSWFNMTQDNLVNNAKIATKDGSDVYLKDIASADEIMKMSNIKNIKELAKLIKTMGNADSLIQSVNNTLNIGQIGSVYNTLKHNTDDLENSTKELKKILLSSISEFVMHNIQYLLMQYEDLCKNLVTEMPSKITKYTLDYYQKYLVGYDELLNELLSENEESGDKKNEEDLKNEQQSKIDSIIKGYNSVMDTINGVAVSGTYKINQLIDQIPQGPKWVEDQVNKQMKNILSSVCVQLFKSYEYLRKKQDIYSLQIADIIGKKQAEKANKKIKDGAIKNINKLNRLKNKTSTFTNNQKAIAKMWAKRIANIL